MLKFVHRPRLEKLEYLPSRANAMFSISLLVLERVYEDLDVEMDPWIMKMQSDPHTANSTDS